MFRFLLLIAMLAGLKSLVTLNQIEIDARHAACCAAPEREPTWEWPLGDLEACLPLGTRPGPGVRTDGLACILRREVALVALSGLPLDGSGSIQTGVETESTGVRRARTPTLGLYQLRTP